MTANAAASATTSSIPGVGTASANSSRRLRVRARGSTHRHRRDEAADGGTPCSSPRLECDDEIEADRNERGRGDGPCLDQGEVQNVQRVEVAGEHSECRRGPGQDCEACDVTQERPAVEGAGAVLGASARKKAGIPIVRLAASVRWRGSSGYAIGVQTHRQDQDRREDRLRHEELRDPLKVAQQAPTFGDHRRHDAEAAADEHHVGHASRHLGTAALHGREPGRLQRRDVVRRRPRPSRRSARRASAPPRRGACPRARSDRPPRSSRRGRRSAASFSGRLVPSATSPPSPTSPAIAATVSGRSRRGSSAPLPGREERNRLHGVRSQMLGEQHERERLEGGRRLLERRGGRASERERDGRPSPRLRRARRTARARRARALRGRMSRRRGAAPRSGAAT